jgi:hypothetical protein
MWLRMLASMGTVKAMRRFLALAVYQRAHGGMLCFSVAHQVPLF